MYVILHGVRSHLKQRKGISDMGTLLDYPQDIVYKLFRCKYIYLLTSLISSILPHKQAWKEDVTYLKY